MAPKRKKKNADLMEWYKGPLTEERVAELRHKLALTRGFLMQLQFAVEGIPSYINLSTESGEVYLDKEYIENLLKETSDP